MTSDRNATRNACGAGGALASGQHHQGGKHQQEPVDEHVNTMSKKRSGNNKKAGETKPEGETRGDEPVAAGEAQAELQADSGAGADQQGVGGVIPGPSTTATSSTSKNPSGGSGCNSSTAASTSTSTSSTATPSTSTSMCASASCVLSFLRPPGGNNFVTVKQKMQELFFGNLVTTSCRETTSSTASTTGGSTSVAAVPGQASGASSSSSSSPQNEGKEKAPISRRNKISIDELAEQLVNVKFKSLQAKAFVEVVEKVAQNAAQRGKFLAMLQRVVTEKMNSFSWEAFYRLKRALDLPCACGESREEADSILRKAYRNSPSWDQYAYAVLCVSESQRYVNRELLQNLSSGQTQMANELVSDNRELQRLLVECHPTMDLVRKYQLPESEVGGFFLEQEISGMRYYIKTLSPALWDHALGFTLLDPRRNFEHRISIHNALIRLTQQGKIWGNIYDLEQKLVYARSRFMSLCAAEGRDYVAIKSRDLCGAEVLDRKRIDANKYLTASFFDYRLKVLAVDEIDWSIFETDRVIGFDTEWRPEFRRGGQGAAAIMQLAFPVRKECWIVDLCLPEAPISEEPRHSKLEARDKLLDYIFDSNNDIKIVGFGLNNDLNSIDYRKQRDMSLIRGDPDDSRRIRRRSADVGDPASILSSVSSTQSSKIITVAGGAGAGANGNPNASKMISFCTNNAPASCATTSQLQGLGLTPWAGQTAVPPVVPGTQNQNIEVAAADEAVGVQQQVVLVDEVVDDDQDQHVVQHAGVEDVAQVVAPCGTVGDEAAPPPAVVSPNAPIVVAGVAPPVSSAGAVPGCCSTHLLSGTNQTDVNTLPSRISTRFAPASRADLTINTAVANQFGLAACGTAARTPSGSASSCAYQLPGGALGEPTPRGGVLGGAPTPASASNTVQLLASTSNPIIALNPTAPGAASSNVIGGGASSSSLAKQGGATTTPVSTSTPAPGVVSGTSTGGVVTGTSAASSSTNWTTRKREQTLASKRRDMGGAQSRKYIDILSLLSPNADSGKKGSLADLAEKVYGKPLSKEITMLNWEVRPLEPIWVEYAALDAIVPVEYYLSHIAPTAGAPGGSVSLMNNSITNINGGASCSGATTTGALGATTTGASYTLHGTKGGGIVATNMSSLGGSLSSSSNMTAQALGGVAGGPNNSQLSCNNKAAPGGAGVLSTGGAHSSHHGFGTSASNSKGGHGQHFQPHGKGHHARGKKKPGHLMNGHPLPPTTQQGPIIGGVGVGQATSIGPGAVAAAIFDPALQAQHQQQLLNRSQQQHQQMMAAAAAHQQQQHSQAQGQHSHAPFLPPPHQPMPGVHHFQKGALAWLPPQHQLPPGYFSKN
ncbi:unnamed protein product [Amoebophrya sp. A25]|nr:unnamed protein product [Amoebophrya sp. A25]|eukprot:GSA25T00017769001.1